ncbi:MAG: cupin domain-containing protein [Pseudomonadota bacterium]|nr:cupin [Gammaproteobacteria bacterium]MEE2683835.1 cupin domain-containing protein [Pseudomonadota bacterium]|tara:strand:+ start:128 stop:667 length:540 start_codon:yes stop_codon:yes gene_type:complete
MKIRRIITGHDDQGKAIIVSDQPVMNIIKPENRPGVEIHNIWQNDSSPAKVFGPEETTDCSIGLLPPKNGSIFRIINFPPEKDWIDNVDPEKAKEAWKSIGAAGVGVSENPPHPLMHRTETVDYALCLEGEMHMVMDNSETLIKAGDVVIQRGTNHAWSNRSEKNCKMMFVLVDGVFNR